MKLIICIDDKNGMMFNNRRQSQDRVLRERITELTKNSKLWMSAYSAKQFTEGGDFTVDDGYALKAGAEDYCFVEDGDLPVDEAREIIVYKWNRKYQADRNFDFDLKANGFKRVSKTDFIGSSHKKITEEIYIKG